MSATLLEKAPAKINLTLRVLGRRADGYHEIESLVAFADFGDMLTLRTDAEEGLEITGPFGGKSGPISGQSGSQGSCCRTRARCRPTGGSLPA